MQEIVKIMCSLGRLTSIAHPPSGPSGAVSYAVGFVPQDLQLQATYRGFQMETSGFHFITGSRSRPQQAPRSAWQLNDVPQPERSPVR